MTVISELIAIVEVATKLLVSWGALLLIHEAAKVTSWNLLVLVGLSVMMLRDVVVSLSLSALTFVIISLSVEFKLAEFVGVLTNILVTPAVLTEVYSKLTIEGSVSESVGDVGSAMRSPLVL